jgi:hypothetical protein
VQDPYRLAHPIDVTQFGVTSCTVHHASVVSQSYISPGHRSNISNSRPHPSHSPDILPGPPSETAFRHRRIYHHARFIPTVFSMDLDFYHRHWWSSTVPSWECQGSPPSRAARQAHRWQRAHVAQDRAMEDLSRVVSAIRYVRMQSLCRYSVMADVCCRNSGPLVYTTVFTRQILILNTAQAVDDLLERRSAVYSDRPQLYFFELAGRSLSVFNIATDHPWFRQYRRLLHGELGPKATVDYADVVRKQSLRFLQRLAKHPSDLKYTIRL